MDQNKLEQNALIEKAIVGILGIPRISANSNVSRSPTHEHSNEFDPNEHKSTGQLLGNSQMGGTSPSTSAHEHLEPPLSSEHQINGELMGNARSDSEPAGLAHNMQFSENASYIFEPATGEEINLGTDIIEILVDMPMCNVEESLLDSDYANILEVGDNSIRPDTALSLSENCEPSSQCLSSGNQFNLVPTEYVTVEDIESFNNTLTFNSYCGDNCYLSNSSKSCLNDSSETIYSSEILVNGSSTPEKGSNQTEVEVTYEERNTSSSDNSVSFFSNDGPIELQDVEDNGHDNTEVDVIIEDNKTPNLLKSDSLKKFYEMNAQLIASENEESANIGDKYIPIFNNKTNDDKAISADHEDKDMPKLLAVTEIPPVQEIYANPPVLKPQVPASKNDVQPKTSVVGVVYPFNRASTATKSQPFSDTTVSQQIAINQSKLETIEDDVLKQNNVRIRVRTRGNQQTSLNVLVKNFPPEVQVKQGISQNYQRKGYTCNKNEKIPVDENLIYSKHSQKVIENNIFFTGNAKSDESKSNFNNVHWYSVDYETCNTKASLGGSTGMKVTFSSLPDLSIDNDAEQGPVNNSYDEKPSNKINVQSTRKFSGPLLRSQQRLDLSKEIPPIRNKSGKNAIKKILTLGKLKLDIKNDESAIKLHHSERKLNNAKSAKHYGITDVQVISSSNLPADSKSINTREYIKKDTNTNLASIVENKARTRTSHRRNSLINNSLLKEHDYFATKKEVSKPKITDLVSPEEKIISERSSISGNKERSLYQDSVDHKLISSIFSKDFCSKNVIVERVHGYETPSTLPSKDHSSLPNFNSFHADSPLNAFDTDSSIHSYIDNSTDTVTKEAFLSLSDLDLYNDINELKSTEDFRKLDSDLSLNSSNIVSNDDDKDVTGVCNEEKRYPEHEDLPIEPEYHENGQAQCLDLSHGAVAIPLPSNTTSIENPKKNKPRQKLNARKNSIPSGDSCNSEMTKSSRVSKPLTKSTRPATKKSYKKTPKSETLILDSDSFSYNLSFSDPSALSFPSEGAGSEDRSDFVNSYDSSSCLSYSINGPLQEHSNLQTSPADFFGKSDTLTKPPQDTEVRISESPDIEGGLFFPQIVLRELDGTILNSITEDDGETGEILEKTNDLLITKVDSTLENMMSYDTEITEVVNSSKNSDPTIPDVDSFANISIPFGLTITPVNRIVEKSIPADIRVTEPDSIAEKIICTDFIVTKNGSSNQISSDCTINDVSSIPMQSHSSRNTSVAPGNEISVDNLKPVQNLILPVEQNEKKTPSGSKIEVIAQNLRLSKQHLNENPLDLVVPKNKITNNKIPTIESNESLPLDNIMQLNVITENVILTKQSEMSVVKENGKQSVSDLSSLPLTNIKQNNDQTLHGETSNAVEMCISPELYQGPVENINHTLLNEDLGRGIQNKETQNQVVVIEPFKNVKLSILDENKLCNEEVINVERTTEVVSAVIEEEIPIDGCSIVQSPMDLSKCHLRENELQNKEIIDNKEVTQLLPCLLDPEVQNVETDSVPHSDELFVLRETSVNNEEDSSDKQDRTDIALIFRESETEIKKREIIEFEPSVDSSQIVIDKVIQNKETIVDQEASCVLSVLVENKIQIITDIEEQALTDISQIIQTAEMENTIGESCILIENKPQSIKNSTEILPNSVFQDPVKGTEIPVECATTDSCTTVKEKVNIEEELSIKILEKEVKKIPDAEISVGDSVTDELYSVETPPIDISIIVTEEAFEHENIVIQKLPTTTTIGNEGGQIEGVVNVPPVVLDNNTHDAQLLSCQNQGVGNKLNYEEVVRNPSDSTENPLQSENSKNGEMQTAEVPSCTNNSVVSEVFDDKECINKNIPFSIESSSLSEEIVIEPTTTENATKTFLNELVESETGKGLISNDNTSCSNTNEFLADSRLRRKISRKRKTGKYRALFKRRQLKTNYAKKMDAQKQSSKRLSLYEDKNQKNIQSDNIADSVVANRAVENDDKIIEILDVQQSTSKLSEECGLFDGGNSATENKECTITDSVNSVNDALLEDNKKYISEVSVFGTSTIQTKSPCDKINDTPLKSNYIVSGKRIIRIQQKKPILPHMDNSKIPPYEKSSQLSAPTCSSNSEILVKNLPSKLSRDTRQAIIPIISNIVRRNKALPLCTVELRSKTDNQSLPQELKTNVNVLDTCKVSKPLPPLIKVDKNTVSKLNKNKLSPVTHESLLEDRSVNEFKSVEEGITLCKLDSSAGKEIVCKVYKDGAKSLNRSDFLSNINPPLIDKPIPKISKIVRGDKCLSTSLDSSYRVFKENTITGISIAHKTLSVKGKSKIDCNTVSLSSTKCERDNTNLVQFQLNHIKPSTSSSSSLDSTYLPGQLAEEVMSNTNLSISKNLSESKTYVKCLVENTDAVSLTPSTSPTKEHIKPVSLASSSKIVNDTTSIAPDLSAANITISKEPLISTIQEPLQEPDSIVKEAEGRAALPTEIPQLSENLQRGTTITQILPTNDSSKVKNTSQSSIASHSTNLSNEQMGKVMINNKDQDLYKNEITNKRKRSARICDATTPVHKSLTNNLDDESTYIVKPSQNIEQNNIFNTASTSKNSKKLNKNSKPMWSTRPFRSKTFLEKLPDSIIYSDEQYNKKYKCLPLNIELSLVDQCINKTKKLKTQKYVESSSTNSVKGVSYNSKNKLGETSGVLPEASCSKCSSVNSSETELNNEITNRYHESKQTSSEGTLLERGTSAIDSVYPMITTNISEQDTEFIDKSKEGLPVIPTIKNTTDVNVNEEKLQEPTIPSLKNTVITAEQSSDFVVTMEGDIKNSKISSPAINYFDTTTPVSDNVENKSALDKPAVHDVSNNTVMIKQSTHIVKQTIPKEQPSIEVEHSILTVEEEPPLSLDKEVPSPIYTVEEKHLTPDHLQDVSTDKSQCVIEDEISPTISKEQPSIEVEHSILNVEEEPSLSLDKEVPSPICTVEEKHLTPDHLQDVSSDKSQCVSDDEISETIPKEQSSIEIEIYNAIVEEVPSAICTIKEKSLTQGQVHAIITDNSRSVLGDEISPTLPKEKPSIEKEPSNEIVEEVPSSICRVEVNTPNSEFPVLCSVEEKPLPLDHAPAISSDMSQCLLEDKIPQTIPKKQPSIDKDPSNVEEKSLTRDLLHDLTDHVLNVRTDKSHCLIEDRTSQTIPIEPPSTVAESTSEFPVEKEPSVPIVKEVHSFTSTVEEVPLTQDQDQAISTDKSQSFIEDEISQIIPKEQPSIDLEPSNARVKEVLLPICTVKEKPLTPDYILDVSTDKSHCLIEDRTSQTIPIEPPSTVAESTSEFPVEKEPSVPIVKEVHSFTSTVEEVPMTQDQDQAISTDKSQSFIEDEISQIIPKEQPSIDLEPSNARVKEVLLPICTVKEKPLTPDYILDVSTDKSHCLIEDRTSQTIPIEPPSTVAESTSEFPVEKEPSVPIVKEVHSFTSTVEEVPLTQDQDQAISTDKSQSFIEDEISQIIPKEQPSIDLEPSNARVKEVLLPICTVKEKPSTPDYILDVSTDKSHCLIEDRTSQTIPIEPPSTVAESTSEFPVEKEPSVPIVKEVHSFTSTVEEEPLTQSKEQAINIDKSQSVIEDEISQTIPKEHPSIDLEPSNARVKEVPLPISTLEETPLTPDYILDASADNSHCLIEDRTSQNIPIEPPSTVAEPTSEFPGEKEPPVTIFKEVPSFICSVEEEPFTQGEEEAISTAESQSVIEDDISQTIPKEQPSIDLEPSNARVKEVPLPICTVEEKPLTPDYILDVSTDKSQCLIEDRTSQNIPIEPPSTVAEPTSEFSGEKEPPVTIFKEVPSFICSVEEEPFTQGEEEAISTAESQSVIEDDISQTIPKEQPSIDLEPSNARVKEVPLPICTVEEKPLTPDYILDVSTDKSQCLIEDRTSQTFPIEPPSTVAEPTSPVENEPSVTIFKEVPSVICTVEEESLTQGKEQAISTAESQSVIEDEISQTVSKEQPSIDVVSSNARFEDVLSPICTLEEKPLTPDHVPDVTTDQSHYLIADRTFQTNPIEPPSIVAIPTSEFPVEKVTPVPIVKDVPTLHIEQQFEVEPSNAVVKEVPSPICTVEEEHLTPSHVHYVTIDKPQCAIEYEISPILPKEQPSIEVEPSNAIDAKVASSICTDQESSMTPDHLHDVTTDMSQNVIRDVISLTIPKEQPSIEVKTSFGIVKEVPSLICTVEGMPLPTDHEHDVSTDKSQFVLEDVISPTLPKEQPSIEVELSDATVQEVNSPKFDVEEQILTPDHVQDVSTYKSQCVIEDEISPTLSKEQPSIEVVPSNAIVSKVAFSICTVEEKPMTQDLLHDGPTDESQCAIDDDISPTLLLLAEVEPSNAIVEEVPSPICTIEEKPLTQVHVHDVSTDKTQCGIEDEISLALPKKQPLIEVEPCNATVKEVTSPKFDVEEEILAPDHVQGVNSVKSRCVIDDVISPTLPKEQPLIEVEPSNAIAEDVSSLKCTVEEEALTPDHVQDASTDKSQCVIEDEISPTLPKEHPSIEVERSNTTVEDVTSPKFDVEEETLAPDHVQDVSTDKSRCVIDDVISPTLSKEQPSIEVGPSNAIAEDVPSFKCTVEEEALTPDHVQDASTDKSQCVIEDEISPTLPEEQSSIEVEPSNVIVKEVLSYLCTVEEEPLPTDHDLVFSADKSQCVIDDVISPTLPKEQPSIEVGPSNAIAEDVPSFKCTVEEEALRPDHVQDASTDKSQCVIEDEISPTLPKEQSSIEVEPSNVIVKEVLSYLCTVEEEPLPTDHDLVSSADKSQCVIDDVISPTLPKEQPSIEVGPSNAIAEDVPSFKCTVDEEALTPDHVHDASTDKSQCVTEDEISPNLPKEQPSIEVEPSKAVFEEVPSPTCAVEEIPLTPDHLYDVTTDKSQCVIEDEISPNLPKEQSSIEVEPSKAVFEEVPSPLCAVEVPSPLCAVEVKPLTPDHLYDVTTDKSQCVIEDEISQTLLKEQSSIEVEPSNAIVKEVPSPKYTVEEETSIPDYVDYVSIDKSQCVHGDGISLTIPKVQPSVELETSNSIVEQGTSSICTVKEKLLALAQGQVHAISTHKSQCVIDDVITVTILRERRSIEVQPSNAIVKDVPPPICTVKIQPSIEVDSIVEKEPSVPIVKEVHSFTSTVEEEPLTQGKEQAINTDKSQSVIEDEISQTIPKDQLSIDLEPSNARVKEAPLPICTVEEKPLIPDYILDVSTDKSQCLIEDRTSQTFPIEPPSTVAEPTSEFPVVKEPSVSIVEEEPSVICTVEEISLTPDNVYSISTLQSMPQSVLSQVPKVQSSVKDEPFKQNIEEGVDRTIVEDDILNFKVVEQSSTPLDEVQVPQSQNVKEFLAVKEKLVIVDDSVVSESEASAQTVIDKLLSGKSVIDDCQPEPVMIEQKLQPTNDNILVQKRVEDGSFDSLKDGCIQDSENNSGSLDLRTTESNAELIVDDTEKTSVEVNGIILGSGDESYSFYTNSIELDMSYRYSLKCYKPKYSPRRAKPKTAKESDLNKNIQTSRVISKNKHSRLNTNATENDISQESNVSKSNKKYLKRKIKSESIGPQTKRSSHSKDFINKKISNILTDISKDECGSVIHDKFKKSLSNSIRKLYKRKLVDSEVQEPPTKISNRVTYSENGLRPVIGQRKPNIESYSKKSLQKSKIFTDKEIEVGNSKSDINDTSGLASDPVNIRPLSINETNANSKMHLRNLMRKCGVRVAYVPLHVYRAMCPNEIINTEVKNGYKEIYCKKTRRNERSPSTSMTKCEEEELQQRVLKIREVRAIKLQRAKIKKTNENSITTRNVSVKASTDSINETTPNVNNIKEQQVNKNNEVPISNQVISRKQSKSDIEFDKFQHPNLSNNSLSQSSGEVRHNISELQETSQEHASSNRQSIEERPRKIIKLSRTETTYTPSTELNRHRTIENYTNPYNDMFNKSYNQNKELDMDEDSGEFLGFLPCLVHGINLESYFADNCTCSMNGTSGLFYRNYEKKLRLLGLPNSSDLMFPSPNNFPSLMPPPDSQAYDLWHIGDPLPSQSNCNFDIEPIGKMSDSNTTHSESSSQLYFSSKNDKDAVSSEVQKKKERRHAVFLCHSGFKSCPPECGRRAQANIWEPWDIPFSEIYTEEVSKVKQKVEENDKPNLPAAPIIDHPLEDISQPGPSGLNRNLTLVPPQEDPYVCSGKAACRCYDCQDLDEDYGR